MILFNDYFLDSQDYILAEVSMAERLRRSNLVDLDPRLTCTKLLNDEDGRNVMAGFYRDSINVARKFNSHIVIGTPTLQANRERIAEANISHNINALAGRFLKYIRAEYDSWSNNICIAGMVGSKYDEFNPEQMLTEREAIDFHEWQINMLDREEMDVFIAYAQPALEEATSLATLMAVTATPYVISFKINKEGKLLDGTSLQEAIDLMDHQGLKIPVGYMINCAFPSLFNLHEQPLQVQERLIGIFADGDSFLDPNTSLEGNDTLESWGRQTRALRNQYRIPVIGGGSLDPQHLHYLAEQMTAQTEY